MKTKREPSEADAFAPGRTVELVCLKGGIDVIRGRIPPDGHTVVVRGGRSKVWPVAGEIFRLEAERTWVFGHTRYVKGLVTGSQLELPRLELEPLALRDQGRWDPRREPWLFDEPDHPLYEEILAAGARPMVEMEQVVPEGAVELRWEEDPILEAVELAAAGAVGEAEDLLGELLSADLRCLDAHAHLGNLEFESRRPGALDRAERHYGIGVRIGELTLGDEFSALLPWGLLDNRPFLRCFQGHGLCLWRKGNLAAAAEVARRLLWLNPHDNQGARFNLAAIEAGHVWDAGPRE